MMAKEQNERMTDFHGGDRPLILAVVLGPIAALSHLLLSYSLVPSACEQGTKILLHASTVLFVLVSLAGVLIGRHYGNAGAAAEPARRERTRWMAMLATALSIFSIVVVLAMELANVILRSCD
jgi:hypothetical protein